MKIILLLLFIPVFAFGQTETILISKFPEDRFEGGAMAFYRQLGQTIKYPRSARESGRIGTCVVSVIISPDGKFKSINFVNPLGKGIEEEVEKAFRGLEQKWLADAKAVNLQLKFIISFMIDGSILMRSSYDKNYFMEELKVVAYGSRSGPITKSEKLIEQLYKFLEKKKYKRAQFFADELIRRDPFNQKWHMAKASIFIEMKDHEATCKTLLNMEELLRIKIGDELRQQYCVQ
ncbi:MAG: energy transducer TonB [Cyclobacteriaceae bacterium]